MSDFWQSKIKTFLHDPPDKALILGSGVRHEDKRDVILSELNLKYNEQLNTADHIASAMQRLNFPENLRKFHVYFTDLVKPLFKHTLSGAVENLEEIKSFMAEHGYGEALREFGFDPEIVRNFLDEEDWKKTYFSLWRFLPEKYSLGYLLPAETRIPDHGIWDHLDVCAAISSCLGDLGLFSVKIPAVQDFISHSRKLSDLWAASHIFSTIIFEGIKTIAEKYGPDVVIYPQLRENPMVDFSFKFTEKNKLKKKVQIANFPNTFLCFVPASKAEEISEDIEDAIKRKWKEITDKAKEILNENGVNIDEELWNNQIENAMEITSAWLDFFNLDRFEGIEKEKEVPEDLREKQRRWLNFIERQETKYGHFYWLTYEILGTILTQKSRFWNAWEEKPVTCKKCLMCGRRNALLENSSEKGYRCWNGEREIWENVNIDDRLKHLLKENERLCAVCLTKRLYGWKPESLFEKIFGKGFKPPDQESVVEIAAKDFIKKVKTDESLKVVLKDDVELVYRREWEEKETAKKFSPEIKKKFDELWMIYGEPNKYYAILMMDGDRIGKMLSGNMLPNFGEFLHPAFKVKIEEWRIDSKEVGKELIEMQRMLTPSHHIAISRAMKDFSIHVVPKIVEEHEGLLVYAGGDDVLALLPSDKVLKAADEIQEYFRKDFYKIEVGGNERRIMGLGNKASMSAGIVFVHYKWPLYDAVEKVRAAEKDAKEIYGRNAFRITFVKRSGEILKAGGKWDVVNDLVDVAKGIVERKISHRFIHDFLDVSEFLEGNMLKAEVRRLLSRRKEKASDAEIKEIERKLLCVIDKYSAHGFKFNEAGKALKILFDAYRGEEK